MDGDARPNILSEIRETCNRVVDLSREHVVVDDGAINDWVERFPSENVEEIRKGVEWDASGWHYSADARESGPLTCQYVFVLDSLNFCFWPTPGLEYDTLATCLKKVLEANEHAFDASVLATVELETVQSWFASSGFELPMGHERVKRLRELGRALEEEFDGLAINVVKRSNHSAAELVKLIVSRFQGFRDTAMFQGGLVHFYKRAQILVGDVWAAYGKPTWRPELEQNQQHVLSFHDLDQLTMFADYRVPQILRSLGILRYSAALARDIDSLTPLPWAGEQEVCIRAATVVAVDRLQQRLAERCNIHFLAIELDWLLWQKGEALKDELQPHHRTLCIYY